MGPDNEGASFDLALNRQSLPGIARLQRIRATADMPGSVASASGNPAYFIGVGAVDAADLPVMLQNLKSPDATVRAEAADDIRILGRKGKTAAAALEGLLKDEAPRVRIAAAAALMQVTPKDAGRVKEAMEVLSAGLESKDSATRRAAATATGTAGAPAGPLTGKLVGLLKDSDEVVRVSALQSISMLGSAAADAVPALIPLLDNADMAIDTADALGRIGAAARPALPRLAVMLSSDQPAMRRAALRGMAQIGGPGARPGGGVHGEGNARGDGGGGIQHDDLFFAAGAGRAVCSGRDYVVSGEESGAADIDTVGAGSGKGFSVARGRRLWRGRRSGRARRIWTRRRRGAAGFCRRG